MAKVFPYPLASVGLLVLWLLLNQSISPGHILLGAIFGVLGALALARLEPPRMRLARFGAFVRLTGRVLVDIVFSNVAVAKIILGYRRGWSSGFVRIPLELRNPYGLAALAGIITSTPGTVWVDFDEASGFLTIHVLDLVDESQWIDTIKGRYERLLLEIFV